MHSKVPIGASNRNLKHPGWKGKNESKVNLEQEDN